MQVILNSTMYMRAVVTGINQALAKRRSRLVSPQLGEPSPMTHLLYTGAAGVTPVLLIRWAKIVSWAQQHDVCRSPWITQ